MDRRHKVRILIAIMMVIIAVTIVVVVGLRYKLDINPVPTPRLLYDVNISPQHLDDIKNVINTTQGTAVHINLTLTSECDTQMAIPIEEVKLSGYSENVTSIWGGSNWDKPLVQKSVFNYSLSLDKLTLQPKMSNFTIITISLADTAPVGRYTIYLDLGNIEFLSTPEEYDISYSTGVELYLIVTSGG
jgi:hypothetical protein